MPPVKPMLDGVELQQTQRIAAEDEEVLAQHGVPALEGDFLQDLGRRATRIELAGVLTGPEVGDGLAGLREKFRAAAPVPFVADIATATRVGDVLIEEMGVRELAGKPARFEYALKLREYTPPPAVTIEVPPVIPPPIIPVEEETGTLVVEVIVEGDPGFDFSKVTVTVAGTERDGDSLSRTLTQRNGNIWTEEGFPAGQYTVQAVVTDPEAMSGSAAAEVEPGETESVTIVLRKGALIAHAFVVHFWFDKAFLEPCLREVVRRAADFSNAHPDEKLLIVGHTDLVGSGDYNQSLSERRGRSIYAFLTFGRDAAARAEAIAEWDLLRRKAGSGLNDSWGTREYQYMLQDIGHYTGNIDGNHGPATDTAIRDFQTDNGLVPDGVLGDQTWAKLIEAYLAQDALAIPEDRFFKNAKGSCNNGIVKWLGCGEQDPVRNTEDAWRPNRRTEMLFVKADTIPCEVPKPVTLATGWCLGPGDPNKRCCFTTRKEQKEGKWLIQPAEPGKVQVSGTITFEDGSPVANARYALLAPDGEYLHTDPAGKPDLGEHPKGAQRGRPIESRAGADGSFSYPREVPEGVFILEIFGLAMPQVARSKEDPPGTAVGNVVCFRLAGGAVVSQAAAPGAAAPGQGKGAIIQPGPSPAPVAVPTITLAATVVVVKKSYTNPKRVKVTLKASASFRGSGKLTRSSTGPVKLFTLAKDGKEIQFDGTDDSFSGDQLKGGVDLFAESASPSPFVDDYKLTLTLPSGAADTKGLTAVSLRLDICAPRTAPGVDPVPLPGNEKVDVGAFVQRGEPNNSHDRTQIRVHPPSPAGIGITHNLVLVRINDKVRAFADEAPLPGQTALPARHPIPPSTIVLPSAFKAFFVEGTAVSDAARDTGFRLGIEGVEDDGDRVAINVFALEIIRQANTVIPMQGDDACLMVSKAVTNVNLPDTATFDGPPGANPDPDTFRLQVRGIPGGESPTLLLDVLRGAVITYTHEFDMLQGVVGGKTAYRINEHVRLVSNAIDDAHLAHQTPLVKLEDVVRATFQRNGQRFGRIDLPVGRPPAEDGPKAIRTVDIHFVTLRGVSSNPQATVDEMSRNWAQLAIRFLLVSTEIVDPVTNVLTVDGTANGNGRLRVDVTPSGGATTTVTSAVTRGQTDEVIAQKLAAAITAQAGIPATHHRNQDVFIVLVNRRNEVGFANVNSNVSTVDFQEPPLNFTDELSELESSILGLNFNDDDPSTIDIIAVGPIGIDGGNLGVTGGDFLAINLPGARNICFIREEAVQTNNTSMQLVAGHEMGHALLDGGNDLHSPVPTNLMNGPASPVDSIGTGKRLSDAQNLRARQRSGPNTVPPLLKKK